MIYNKNRCKSITQHHGLHMEKGVGQLSSKTHQKNPSRVGTLTDGGRSLSRPVALPGLSREHGGGAGLVARAASGANKPLLESTQMGETIWKNKYVIRTFMHALYL
jgi:hypothetical protein